MTVKQASSHSSGSATASTGRMIVARFLDGKVVKGTTQDFLPNKATFHVYENGDEGSSALELSVVSLKAVFFVKSFEGREDHVEDYSFEKTKGYGRKCVVKLIDGEIITGYTSGYGADRPGFFLIPAEADSNNARVFIVNKAVLDIRWI
jgi:hypothetical protein